MSEIDWQADLEKKLNNLVRNFVAEVQAHGDGDLIQDGAGVHQDKYGFIVHVLKPIEADKASLVPTAKKKRGVVEDESDENIGDDTGDD